ncbi:hypothetical protein B0H17DRAFT_667649 [Mycena rosella]|uniref:Mediator of RNA polymerase II transcription subunit 8 n=1 Tax=Mycena rosella TaxID=1033263 RepID=A0AAD7M892_MYCRO|nr:hypothetical protein B0H17DRAFT_667649 [Mycena rosella]
MTSFESSSLPVDQLESLRFKANQIIESIYGLQRTIEAGNQNYMPAWPDILSKYNMLLSQTHNFSTALVAPVQGATISFGANGVPQISKPTAGVNPYEALALHPSVGMSDTQLDNEVIPLLRNQQTTDVLRMENDTVRRLSEHMATRGALGVLGAVLPPPPAIGVLPRKPEYEDVLRECDGIRAAHDQRVERAVRAVAMLRDKFELRQRVQVEVEEPEELSWDPRLGMPAEAPGGDAGMESAEEEGSSDDDEEDVAEGELVGSSVATDSPAAATTTSGLFAFAPASVTVTPSNPMTGSTDVSMF